MEVIKFIGVGLFALVSIIVIKQYKPEFAVYITIIAGVLILIMMMDKLSAVINLLNELSNKSSNGSSEYIKILLKITGISILTEFAVSICNDSKETAIANKIDLGGKIIIISMSVPIITSLLELVLKILP